MNKTSLVSNPLTRALLFPSRCFFLQLRCFSSSLSRHSSTNASTSPSTPLLPRTARPIRHLAMPRSSAHPPHQDQEMMVASWAILKPCSHNGHGVINLVSSRARLQAIQDMCLFKGLGCVKILAFAVLWSGSHTGGKGLCIGKFWGLGIQIASSGVFFRGAIAKGHRMLRKRRVALTRNTDMCLLFDQRESYNNTN